MITHNHLTQWVESIHIYPQDQRAAMETWFIGILRHTKQKDRLAVLQEAIDNTSAIPALFPQFKSQHKCTQWANRYEGQIWAAISTHREREKITLAQFVSTLSCSSPYIAHEYDFKEALCWFSVGYMARCLLNFVRAQQFLSQLMKPVGMELVEMEPMGMTPVMEPAEQTQKPTVAIYVRQGVIQQVLSSHTVEARIIDESTHFIKTLPVGKPS